MLTRRRGVVNEVGRPGVGHPSLLLMDADKIIDWLTYNQWRANEGVRIKGKSNCY